NSATVKPVSAGSKEQFAWGLERFRQEAATLVNFEHPNIVSVYRYFEANGTAYLVMQYVEGKPLDAILSGGKTLAESEIDEVIGPIMNGLEQVHAAHFLHRDIKPANIYIRKDGRPVLLDFGAARQAFGSETKSITAIVSEGYAPFEQYEAKGDQGPWTDVYALGAVLYRCIAGQRPPSAPERVSARLRNDPDPLAPARDAAKEPYSAKLLDAIDRALGTMRNERPQSVAELRALLRPSSGEAGRSRLASMSAVKSATPPSRPATAPVSVAPAAAQAKPKSRTPMIAGMAVVLAAGAVAAYFALAPGKAPEQRNATGPSAPPATMNSGPTTPPRGVPDETAERVAATAAEEAAGIVESARQAIEKGELERGRDELRLARRRVEDALGRRPGHAALERVLGAVSVADADLARRIAARVKELSDGAERQEQRQNRAEADRLIAEAERLDPAAAKTVRDKLVAARKQAEEELARGDAEMKRQEEARRAKERE
ncbi:MAG: serine/threonine protein kinase, partial [Alphaproteobacteria bacterium]